MQSRIHKRTKEQAQTFKQEAGEKEVTVADSRRSSQSELMLAFWDPLYLTERSWSRMLSMSNSWAAIVSKYIWGSWGRALDAVPMHPSRFHVRVEIRRPALYSSQQLRRGMNCLGLPFELCLLLPTTTTNKNARQVLSFHRFIREKNRRVPGSIECRSKFKKALKPES